MSTKQVNNTKAPKADSSKSKEQEAQKGNAMATADKTNTPAPEAAPQTLADLLKAKADLEISIKAALSTERPNALARIKEEIKLYSFTAKELGLASAAPSAAPAPEAASTPASAPASGTNKMKKDLKSTKTGDLGVWLALPPKFLKEEGAFEAFAKGESMDAWLVDPSDTKSRKKLLYKLSQDTEFKIQPNKEQLGALWSEKWEKFSAENGYK